VHNMSEVWSPEVEAAARQMLTYSFVGSAATLADEMGAFIRQTDINEIMATAHIFDHSARVKSYRLFSEVMKGMEL
jgi:alkanesulfonate monooxygenase SsuD/methylene tetrahydromethanopterin reductase-like flavin-dependent oxidoreductase (luciferase family)